MTTSPRSSTADLKPMPYCLIDPRNPRCPRDRHQPRARNQLRGSRATSCIVEASQKSLAGGVNVHTVYKVYTAYDGGRQIGVELGHLERGAGRGYWPRPAPRVRLSSPPDAVSRPASTAQRLLLLVQQSLASSDLDRQLDLLERARHVTDLANAAARTRARCAASGDDSSPSVRSASSSISTARADSPRLAWPRRGRYTLRGRRTRCRPRPPRPRPSAEVLDRCIEVLTDQCETCELRLREDRTRDMLGCAESRPSPPRARSRPPRGASG